ncbi:hypothetical protein LTR78_000586 [Recurvomyces mirabilis]|uniref:Uncharacterized protein n=1 Tax=Recurvomyces mirabilis TaxID=574656 RepID=A0AAE1C6R8_9PEZI|nr:hypothetical protein LTR78_000586 [Recurvomyces mirabilis]KAK5162240.1 hypothetical protein LTS14_000587 [Recurvomyces mirabilis]
MKSRLVQAIHLIAANSTRHVFMMHASKRQKIDRETTAAYGASQPLFDALRKGAANAGEQKLRLTKARDLVQTIHVKLVEVDKNDSAQAREEYISSLTKAWASATDAYCTIFEELCKVTEANPVEGREESKGHAQFKNMAETAAAASAAARAYTTSDSRAASESAPEATPATSRSTKRTVDALDDSMMEQAPSSPQQNAPNHGAKRTNKRAKVDRSVSSIPITTGQATPAPPKKMAAIEYEDVSAEVTARLKAKADKRKAKKQERKRKRESGDSQLDPAVLAEKPDKKKPKTLTSGTSNNASPGKRKQDDVVAGAASGEAVAAKKRKKRHV